MYVSRMPAKRFSYSVSLDRSGGLLAEGEHPLDPGEAWTPEHLVLAGLAECSLASLAYHAERMQLSTGASADASGAVTKREEDGRYAFVEVQCGLDVAIEPEPAPEALADLLARAERDCFISASLTVKTEYEWRVNGRAVRRTS